LLSQGVCTEEELKKIEDNINNIFAEGYNARENYKQIDADWLECNWKGALIFILFYFSNSNRF
jgi:hypothetical protein